MNRYYVSMALVHKSLVNITISSLISKVGFGLVGVFLPLILLNEGLELWQVSMFYVCYGISKIIINYPVFNVINNHGAKFGLVSGYFAGSLQLVFISLYIATHSYFFLGLAAFSMAIMNSFLWNSQHLHISSEMNSARKSRDLAMIANLSRIAGIISPFLGGLIAVWLGSGWLTVIAAAIGVVAVVPILKIKSMNSGENYKVDFKYSLKYAPKRDLIANAGYNAHAEIGVMVWPIYLAVFIPSFTKIGYIDAISTAVAVVVLHFVARRGDSGKSYRNLIEGSGFSAVVHIGRVFASSNPFTITLISSFYDVALSYQQNPWTSTYYEHAKKHGLSYILSMEIAGDLTRVVLWGFLGAVAYFAGSDSFFNLAFLLAAIVVWLCLLITKENSVEEKLSGSAH